MPYKPSAMRQLALAAIAALGSSASQAEITVYTSKAAFTAATTAPGTDSFSDLSITTTTDSPLSRSTNSGVLYSFGAAAFLPPPPEDPPGTPDSSIPFFGGSIGTDVYLSTNVSNGYIVLSAFSSPVNAVGGNIFATDYESKYLLGNLTVVAVDSTGSKQVNIVGAQTSTFIGLVSNATLISVKIASVTPDASGNNYWPSVDNVVLAQAVAVPEPETYALMLSGLAFVGFLARRRGGRSAD